MTSFTVAPEAAEANLLGKLVSSLQSDVLIEDDEIVGTLANVTGYTGFSGNVAEQSGHYIALKVTPDVDDAVVTVELIGGTVGHPVTLDEDMNIVIRITNPATQSIQVVATKDNVTITKTYDISGLTLAD